MAYVTQEVIEKARTAMKVLNKEYGVKSSMAGKNSSTLSLTISEGSIDFIESFASAVLKGNYFMDNALTIQCIKKTGNIAVNHYKIESYFEGKALEYLEKAKEIMCIDHYDNSDAQIDYFDCSYYISITVGRWNKRYVLNTEIE
jgi:hypothetical protein